MAEHAFVDNAKVMAKGQITIPKDVREVLGVSSGDRVTFVVEGKNVRLVNSAVYAMQILQREMAGEAQRAGLESEGDVMALVNELRNEDREGMRVLIDTNVLISAALNAESAPFQAYVKAASYPNRGLICEQNVDELKRIFNKKFPQRLAALDRFLSLALLTLELVPVPLEETGAEALIRDGKDRPILRAAIAGKRRRAADRRQRLFGIGDRTPDDPDAGRIFELLNLLYFPVVIWCTRARGNHANPKLRRRPCRTNYSATPCASTGCCFRNSAILRSTRAARRTRRSSST